MSSDKKSALYALAETNTQLQEMFDRLDKNDPSLFYKKPSESVWSVIQVLDHLLDSEEKSLKYIHYKLSQGSEFEKEGLMTRLKYLMVINVFTLPVKFKAPKGLNQPTNTSTYKEIKIKFVEFRKSMKDFIESRDDNFFELASVKHPRIGRIKLEKMIRFFGIHQRHHEKQILRRLSDYSQ